MKIYSVSYSTLPSQCRTRSSSLVFTARLLSYTSHFPTGLYISEATVKNPENRNTLNRSITTWVPLTFNELAKKKEEERSETRIHSWCGDGTSLRFYIFIATIYAHLFGRFLPLLPFFSHPLCRETPCHTFAGETGKKIVCAHRRGTTTAAGADHGKFYV